LFLFRRETIQTPLEYGQYGQAKIPVSQTRAPQIRAAQGRTMLPRITLTDAPDDIATHTLSQLITQFNQTASGRSNDFRPLAILVSDPETDETLGGLWGWTSFAFLHIDLFYLPEQLRGTGLGRSLIQQAEAEAIQRGCTGAWLDTFSFQARGFYERLGYTVFGSIENYPPGESRFFLKKTFPGKSLT
jgi:GNAT superfamily N-acetyltransferase